ncbi:MAG: GDSL-type esterase/lipase family protein [Rhodocyclaceae bacterium]
MDGARKASGPVLTGVVSVGGPLAGASVTVADASGQKRSTKTDAAGVYVLDTAGLVAPVVVSAVEAGNDNCTDSGRLWSRCMASVLANLSAGESRANINALTDKIVSDVAQGLKYKGPQGIVDAGTAKGVTADAVQKATEALRPVFAQALRDAGVADTERFDPVGIVMKADRKGVDAILDVLVHNRGYDNNSGVPGGTLLLDADYRYVGKMDAISSVEPLDLKYAQAAKAKIVDPAFTRIVIVGDSTASTYELARLPRMGWGQVFEPLFKADAKVKVLNGAKSGRSARAFLNQAYFAQMAAYLRAGDYVLIHMGHNDQNCESDKKDRGAADVANLCTYPNDAAGKPQFPAGKPEMSFQKTLETYIEVARAKGAIPVLMTPTTRVWNKDRKEGFPVVPNHFTRQNPAGGIAFIGDYAQTIRDAARANKLPLIDIEAKTISFVNAHEQDWRDYWLAADPLKFPWYATQSVGTFAKPDTTHFQQKGAEAVATMVVEGLRETPELKALAAKLK